jgi:predicted nucleic acid-binding protein
MPTIYLDVCCLNRPFDDQTQERVRLEAEAILYIFSRIEAGIWEWICSEAFLSEVAQTPDTERRARLEETFAFTTRTVLVTENEEARAEELRAHGFHLLDALHIACAENGQTDVLLTVDERFLRRAARLASLLKVRIANPLTWLQEVLNDDD